VLLVDRPLVATAEAGGAQVEAVLVRAAEPGLLDRVDGDLLIDPTEPGSSLLEFRTVDRFDHHHTLPGQRGKAVGSAEQSRPGTT